MKTENILGAIRELYKYHLGDLYPDIITDIEVGYLTENEGRSGRKGLWYKDETKEIAIDLNPWDALTEEEIEDELL